MQQAAKDLEFSTSGEVEVKDITDDVDAIVDASGVATGQALVHTHSSTSAITTLEHEPGLAQEDVPEALDRLFPRHGDEAPAAEDGEVEIGRAHV